MQELLCQPALIIGNSFVNNLSYISGGYFKSNNYRVPAKSEYTISEALGKWVNKEDDEFKYNHVDVV
jgi:hypothetical protein